MLADRQTRNTELISGRNMGFTLAEVLITLGIIGVVAALTIPTLMNNIQKQQYKVAWKKAFSVMSSATKMLTIDGGGSIANLYTDNNQLLAGYSTTMKFVKTCNLNTAGCWHADNAFKWLRNSNCPYGYNIGASAVAADGSLFFFYLNSQDCSETWGTTGHNRCAEIWVDVNGFKNPNMVGEDIFATSVTTSNVYPRGIAGDSANALMCAIGSTDADNLGWGCSAKYLFE